MKTYEHGVRGARGAYLAAGPAGCDRERFQDYSAARDLDREFPGALGFGLIRRVAADHEASFTAAARADGWPEFAVRQLAPHDGERYVIQYIEPIERNRAAVGLDIASEPRRRLAAETAMREGEATLTAPITLVQATGKPARSFLVMLPIYQPHALLDTIDQRQAATIGWSYAALVIDDVLRGVDDSDAQYVLALSDLTAPVRDHFYGARGQDAEPDGAPSRQIPFRVLGRTWLAELRASPAFVRQFETPGPRRIAIGGGALSGLLAMLLYLLAQRAERNRQLRREQERRAAIAAGSSDAIIGESLDGKTIRDVSEARRAREAVEELNATLERQVTERTAELHATARDLRTILDVLPSMVGYWDANLCNRMANRAYSRWFGVDPDLLRGRCLRDLMGPTLFEAHRPHIEATLRGEPQTFERAIPTPDGTGVRHSLAHYLPDIIDGEVKGFYALVHDITELVDSRLQVAAAQRDNHALLLTIKQQAIVSVTDRAGRITEVSDSFCAISGYTRDELVGRNHRMINSGQQGREFWIDMWRTVSSGQPWRSEVCNRAKDGSLYWVDSLVSPFFDADGNVEKYISIRTDITARKRAEAELLATSNLLTAVLAAASEVSIIATDVDGTITVFNRGAERMLGYRAAEMVRRCTPDRIQLPDEVEAQAAEHSAQFGNPISGLRAFLHHPEHRGAETRECTYVRKDGSHVPVSLTVTALRDGEGKPFGFLGVAHDVSAQKQIERSLRDAIHSAHNANLAKSQFLANISHEIRTPMNAVIGLSYLLERTALDREQAGFLAKIQLASKSLLSIISDVLDLSKIEAAELTLERAPFQLDDLLGDVSTLMAVQAEAKRIEFRVHQPPTVDRPLEGDATRLRQILINLLSNAIKFTERGTVELAVRLLSATRRRILLRFAVADTGIGIAPEALPRLLAPFVQADESTTRRFGGTGLGLSIVKQLTSLMGGEVGVSSRPQHGSEFWVDLEFPLGDSDTLPPVHALSAPIPLLGLPGVRVLVADDSPINLEVARRVLELEGAVVGLATNGQEAVEVLLNDPGGYDVVLMDIHMPVLDGVDATRRIRGGLGLTELPIIALTAGTLSSEQQEAESVGVKDFLSKPFEPQALVRCVRRHVRRAAGDAGAAMASAPVPAPVGDWPEIAGIDRATARRRLRGDVGLFRSMLRRMLADFVDLDRADIDLAGADQLLARLHNLKGVAGTLGANDIQQLAASTELACRARTPERVAALMTELVGQLHRLRISCGAWLAEPSEDEVNSDQLVPLDRDDLTGLLTLLRGSDLAALERFAALAPALRQRLGSAAFGAMRHQIDNLEFADATAALEGLAARS
ncbi:MAG TPA: CHASE domain-containing protein [Kofleriaceae bacterium]